MNNLNKLAKMEHPLLTEPGTWFASGHGMSGEPLDRIPIQGRVRISHEDGKIVNEGDMAVVSKSNPVTFRTSYEMKLTEDELVLDFFQANEPVGNMTGKIVVFDDRLVSTYTSGDGSLAGYEVLQKMGDNRYSATGVLTENSRMVNLWKLDLVRQAQESVEEEEA